jgi:steroid delta-isomerase-like uncharacterized protein
MYGARQHDEMLRCIVQASEESRVAVKPSELVERFYHQVWNRADEAEAQKILAADFRFRASLGPELRGPGGFIAYLRSVRAALENFTCTIEELIAADDCAAARMRFSGRHRGKMFGIEATGRGIVWSGAAFFKTRGGFITELWVLGDIEAVRRQLAPERPVDGFQV